MDWEDSGFSEAIWEVRRGEEERRGGRSLWDRVPHRELTYSQEDHQLSVAKEYFKMQDGSVYSLRILGPSNVKELLLCITPPLASVTSLTVAQELWIKFLGQNWDKVYNSHVGWNHIELRRQSWSRSQESKATASKDSIGVPRNPNRVLDFHSIWNMGFKSRCETRMVPLLGECQTGACWGPGQE